MQQLKNSDANGHRRKTNINHSEPIFESDNEEGTKHRTKPKTSIILLSEDEEEKKGEHNKGNEEYEYDP